MNNERLNHFPDEVLVLAESLYIQADSDLNSGAISSPEDAIEYTVNTIAGQYAYVELNRISLIDFNNLLDAIIINIEDRKLVYKKQDSWAESTNYQFIEQPLTLQYDISQQVIEGLEKIKDKFYNVYRENLAKKDDNDDATISLNSEAHLDFFRTAEGNTLSESLTALNSCISQIESFIVTRYLTQLNTVHTPENHPLYTEYLSELEVLQFFKKKQSDIKLLINNNLSHFATYLISERLRNLDFIAMGKVNSFRNFIESLDI